MSDALVLGGRLDEARAASCGLVFDEGVRWPVERSSWTSAAVVLAADALAGGPTLALFAGDELPTGVLLAEDACVC